jgi:hypothetical protein
MKTLPIQPVRKIVQYSFLALIVLIGVQFALFVNQLEKGLLPTVTRPPGIEGFLPISSLISFKYWLVTGIFNPIHPSGQAWLLQLGVPIRSADRVFKSAASAYFQKRHPGPPLAGLSAAQFKVSAAFLFYLGHHHQNECPRPGLFYLQPLQHGGGY